MFLFSRSFTSVFPIARFNDHPLAREGDYSCFVVKIKINIPYNRFFFVNIAGFAKYNNYICTQIIPGEMREMYFTVFKKNVFVSASSLPRKKEKYARLQPF